MDAKYRKNVRLNSQFLNNTSISVEVQYNRTTAYSGTFAPISLGIASCN